MKLPTDITTLLTEKISCDHLGTIMGVCIEHSEADEALDELVRQSGLQMEDHGKISVTSEGVEHLGDQNELVDFTIPIWGVLETAGRLDEAYNKVGDKEKAILAILRVAWLPFLMKAIELCEEGQKKDDEQTFGGYSLN